MSKYLIVVDVQKDFVDGALGSDAAKSIIPRVKEKLMQYYANHRRVIFTRDTHALDYLETNEGKHLPVEHCVAGTEGWEIYDGIVYEGLVQRDAAIINKPTFGYLGWEDYIDDDNNLEIELVGLCTDICVVSNALILKAMFPEARIVVDSAACAGVTPASHEAALNTMRMCQVEVV